jgi:2-polyprenyl-3-methyl-5-hydroxy-6-metoxy-1,4-benzoquinol methylase
LSYDKSYSKTKNVFGSEPEKILVRYADKIDKSKPVLYIGAGQGRNAFYLADMGFHIEAIDPSSVAIETINKIASEKKYSIISVQSDYENYNPPKIYSAILVFGLIQILDWKSIISLTGKIENRTASGSLVFVTAFSKKDSSFQNYSAKWNAVGKNSFTDGNGNHRIFLEENEILKLFENYAVLYHWEGPGKKHTHGDGPVEQHEMIELVIKKK